MSAKSTNARLPRVLGLTRISLGLVFLWAFFDKLIGLGFATCRNADTDAIEVMCSKAWLEGGSPTTGFLKFGTSGPFADFYQGLAGNVLVDWLFMLGLLGIGVALTFGIAMRLGAASAAAMLVMMYTAALPLENNPVIDDHIVYALLALSLWKLDAGKVLGMGERWSQSSFAKNWSLLR